MLVVVSVPWSVDAWVDVWVRATDVKLVVGKVVLLRKKE